MRAVPVGFVAGLVTGAVVMAIAALWWRRLRPAPGRLRYLVAAGVVLALAMAAGVLYLAAGGHAPADDTDSATVSAPAAAHPADSATPVVTATSAAGLAEASAGVNSQPQDANTWLALAEQRHAQHDNAAARAAYAQVIALQGMSAQSWADYAEVLSALAGGSLGGEAGTAIDNALHLDAWNPKAMWLKASQAQEQQHDEEALVWWRRLRAVLPPDSPDAPIVDAKIAETEAVAHTAPPPPPPPNPLQTGR
jgi:cytochrome c-type biogenesis protein CcmH